MTTKGEMMFLQVVRRNPVSDLNPYVHRHWIIGRFTQRQLRWIEKFSHRTRRNLLEDISLRWTLLGSTSTLAQFPLGVSISSALLIAGVATVIGFGFHLRFALRAWKNAESYIRNRELVVREGDASWSAVHGIIADRIFSDFESDEVLALDDFFCNVTHHDKLMSNRELEPSDKVRIEADLMARVNVLGEELRYRRGLNQVTLATHAEFVDKAAIFDKLVAKERQQQLHECVVQTLNQPH